MVGAQGATALKPLEAALENAKTECQKFEKKSLRKKLAFARSIAKGLDGVLEGIDTALSELHTVLGIREATWQSARLADLQQADADAAQLLTDIADALELHDESSKVLLQSITGAVIDSHSDACMRLKQIKRDVELQRSEISDLIGHVDRKFDTVRSDIAMLHCDVADERDKAASERASMDRRLRSISAAVSQFGEQLHGGGYMAQPALPIEYDAVDAARVWGRRAPVPTPFFSGRDGELRDITNALEKCHAAAITAHGGMGKSQLMLQFANRAASSPKYPGGVFWVSAADIAVLTADLAELVGALSGSARDVSDLEVVCTAAFAALHRRDGSWLLCIDNADSIDIIVLLGKCRARACMGATAQPRGDLLVTSRSADPAVWPDLGVFSAKGGSGVQSHIKLTPLGPKSSAVVMFRRKEREAFDISDDEVAGKLAALDPAETDAVNALAGSSHDYSLAGLPLALLQAGVYMSSRRKTFAEYLRLFVAMFVKNRTSKMLPTIDGVSEPTARAVHTTWALNVSDLSDKSLRILNAAALCAPDNIPKALLRQLVVRVVTQDSAAASGDDSGPDEEEVEVEFDDLVVQNLVNHASLVSNSTDLSNFSMHRVLRSFVLQRPEFVINTAVADAAAALKATADVWCDGCKTRWSRRKEESNPHALQLLPHVAYMETHITESRVDHAVAVDLAIFAAGVYLVLSACVDAARWGGISLRLQQYISSDAPDLDLAAALEVAGDAQQRFGAYQTAQGYHTQSLEMRQLIHGTDVPHIDTATSLHAVGNALAAMSDNKGALVMFTACTNMFKQIHNDVHCHTDIAELLLAIGLVQCNMGDYDEALTSCHASLKMFNELCDKNIARKAFALLVIGGVQRGKKEYRNALASYIKGLQWLKWNHGDTFDHSQFAATFQEIGNVYLDMARLDLANKWYIASLEMSRRIHGTDHTSIAVSMHGLGNVLCLKAEYDSALELHAESLTMWRRVHGEVDHHNIASSLHATGDALAAKGNLDDALVKFTESRYMQERLQGDNLGWSLCSTLRARAVVLSRLRRFAEGATAFSELAVALRMRGASEADLTDALRGEEYCLYGPFYHVEQ
jgi:tetratricopeptide (TPR) repeat protein